MKEVPSSNVSEARKIMIRKLVAMPVAPAGSKVLLHRNVKHEDDMCPRFISVVRDMNDTNLCVRTRLGRKHSIRSLQYHAGECIRERNVLKTDSVGEIKK